MFKVVLFKYSTCMFLFHTFILALAISHLYKFYDFFNKYKRIKTSTNLDKYITAQFNYYKDLHRAESDTVQ